MTDAEKIKSLGGVAKLSKLLGFKTYARVSNWMRRGIPSRIKLQYPELFLNDN